MRIALVLVALSACGSHSGGETTDADGTGGSGDRTDAPNGEVTSCAQLAVTLRDFKSEHPDFEHVTSTDDHGIVATMLDADGKPVYAHASGTPSVSSATSFDQWYRDTPGVNMRDDQILTLVENPPGTYTFDDQTFFPLDGKGWPGTEQFGHNFLFTTELHTNFKYRGGERFDFDGDDDLFIFVNNRLALDLGGVHVAESGTIDFDAKAAELGLEIGGVYPLTVFHAERHTDQSHFKMVTSIDCFVIF